MKAFFSLGSNLGDRRKNLATAVKDLTVLIGELERESRIYQTAPWGKKDQPAFLNQVIQMETLLDAQDIVKKIGQIEGAMGRIRKEKWGPRLIDIDLLFLEKLVVSKPGLVVPHPGIVHRRFVLLPLSDIAPDLVHPTENQTITDLLISCEDKSDADLLEEGGTNGNG